MHRTRWYHCSKDTSVFPRVGSLLNVLILRVSNLSVIVSVLRRWPTFSSVWGAPAVCYASLLCPHPPLKGHFPIIQVSVNSTHRAMPPTQGWPKWGCHPLPPGCFQLDFIQHFPALGIIEVPNCQVELQLGLLGLTGGPPPHSGSIPEYQRDVCPSRSHTPYTLTCAPVGGWTWILIGSYAKLWSQWKDTLLPSFQSQIGMWGPFWYPKAIGHLPGVPDPDLCTIWPHPPPGRSWDGTECHHLVWQPGYKCS